MEILHVLVPSQLKNALREVAARKGNSFSSEVRDRLFASLQEDAIGEVSSSRSRDAAEADAK